MAHPRSSLSGLGSLTLTRVLTLTLTRVILSSRALSTQVGINPLQCRVVFRWSVTFSCHTVPVLVLRRLDSFLPLHFLRALTQLRLDLVFPRALAVGTPIVPAVRVHLTDVRGLLIRGSPIEIVSGVVDAVAQIVSDVIISAIWFRSFVRILDTYDMVSPIVIRVVRIVRHIEIFNRSSDALLQLVSQTTLNLIETIETSFRLLRGSNWATGAVELLNETVVHRGINPPLIPIIRYWEA